MTVVSESLQLTRVVASKKCVQKTGGLAIRRELSARRWHHQDFLLLDTKIAIDHWSERYAPKYDIRTIPVFVRVADLHPWRAGFQDLAVTQIHDNMSRVGNQITAL